jgi:hypothetical protein
MFRLIGNRGTEKTKKLMEQAYQNNGIFVCQNAVHMREKADNYGFKGLIILSYDNLISDIKEHELPISKSVITGYMEPEGRSIYIDSLEGFVQFICLNKFVGYNIDL